MTKKSIPAWIIAILVALGLWTVKPAPPTPLPTPSPTASATATPEPSPSPTVAPTPSPLPSPSVPVEVDCPIKPRVGACDERPSGSEPFRQDLENAIAWAKDQGHIVGGKIANEKAYVDAIAKRLRTVGVCAINGSLAGHTGQDEAWLRGFGASYHYDIASGSGDPILLYASRCSPPQF